MYMSGHRSLVYNEILKHSNNPRSSCNLQIVVVVVIGFYVPPTAKVIRRRDLRLKSHQKD